MEQRTATIPFDLETAKKINIGEIAGRIVTEKGQNRAEIVYEDNSSKCTGVNWYIITLKIIE